ASSGRFASHAPAPMTSSSACATTSTTGPSGCITTNHARAELGELFRVLWRTRVMRLHSAVLRRKTECDGHVEFFERLHLPVEPRLRVRPEAVGPAQTGSEITDSQAAQPVYCRIEP